MPLSASPPSDLWAIAGYFNPVGFKRRLSNYRLFRKHLCIPLATVELSFDGRFELSQPDADILLQLSGGDVMWQKERLLNLALAMLPDTCTKVVWLDCDLIFEAPDWARMTSERLDDVPLVQPFSHAYRTPPGWQPGDGVDGGGDFLQGMRFLIDNGRTVEECMLGRAEDMRAASGMAWGARRSVIGAHGLYDACIMGGGDSALLRAAHGYLDTLVERQRMTGPREQHFRAWGEAFRDAVDGRVGHVPGTIHHLWHGAIERREYALRFEVLKHSAFDPFEDVALTDSGVWGWSSSKPDLHARVRDYFAARREDG